MDALPLEREHARPSVARGAGVALADAATPRPHVDREVALRNDSAALQQLLRALSDAIDAGEPIPPRVGRAYNAVLATVTAPPRDARPT